MKNHSPHQPPPLLPNSLLLVSSPSPNQPLLSSPVPSLSPPQSLPTAAPEPEVVTLIARVRRPRWAESGWDGSGKGGCRAESSDAGRPNDRCGAAAWKAAGEAFKLIHPHHGLPDSAAAHLAEPVGAGEAGPDRRGAGAPGHIGSVPRGCGLVSELEDGDSTRRTAASSSMRAPAVRHWPALPP